MPDDRALARDDHAFTGDDRSFTDDDRVPGSEGRPAAFAPLSHPGSARGWTATSRCGRRHDLSPPGTPRHTRYGALRRVLPVACSDAHPGTIAAQGTLRGRTRPMIR